MFNNNNLTILTITHYSNAPYLLAQIVALINLIIYWQIHSFPPAYIRHRFRLWILFIPPAQRDIDFIKMMFQPAL